MTGYKTPAQRLEAAHKCLVSWCGLSMTSKKSLLRREWSHATRDRCAEVAGHLRNPRLW